MIDKEAATFGTAAEDEGDAAALADLADLADLTALIPPSLSRYAPAVAEALGAFVEALPEERAAALLFEQLAMPADADPIDRLLALARACPAMHKLGQVMARDARLAPELRGQLQTLESLEPSLDREAFREALEAELGPLENLGVALGEPLAEASVAVVAAFEHPTHGEGVFKLLKPGIERRLEEDFAALGAVGRALDAACERLNIPRVAYAASLGEVVALLRLETDLAREQKNLTRARRALRRQSDVAVPRPFPDLSGPRVTAMRRLRGVKLSEARALPEHQRRRLVDALIEAVLAAPLWEPSGQAPFHADPHAGNLLVTEEGKLGILDWSLTGALSKAEREALAQVLVGAVTLDEAKARAAVAEVALPGGDREALDRAVTLSLGEVRAGRLPGARWLTSLLDRATLDAGCLFSGGMLLYRKATKTALDLAAELGQADRIERVVAMTFVRRLSAEWASRLWALPGDRSFGTHLTNAELNALWWQAPWLAARFGLSGLVGSSVFGAGGGNRADRAYLQRSNAGG